MSKPMSDLKSAIQGLKINAPFDLRKQGQVTLSPPQPEPPQKEARQIEPARTNSAPPQSEAPRKNGFFRLAHAVFADPELRILSGDSFRLFIWLSTVAWRYQDSDGTLRASISYMEAGTGISHATVSRALAQLKGVGLVKLVQTDFKRGNVWQVSKRALYSSDSEGPAPSNRGSGAPKSSEQPTRNEAEERSSNNLPRDPKNSLCQSYLDSVKPARKQESEREAFLSLRKDFSEEQIQSCLRYLESKGIPGTGAPCHSPMAYLAKAITQVLPAAGASRKTSESAEARRSESDEDDQDSRRREEAFRAAFPTQEQQREVLSKYSARFPFLNQNGPAVRGLAIGSWWNETREGELQKEAR